MRGFGKHTVKSYALDHSPIEKGLEEEFSKLLDNLHNNLKPRVEEGPAKRHSDLERYLVLRDSILVGIGSIGFEREQAYLGGATVVDDKAYTELLKARVIKGIRKGYTDFQVDLKRAKNRDVVETVLENFVLEEFESIGCPKINPYSVTETKSYTVMGYKLKYGRRSEIIISLNAKTTEIPYSPRVGVNW